MNKFLKLELQKFVLVLFDDILIYNHAWDNHLLHVDKVLYFLQENQLFVKNTKCSFGASEVEYLGHIVSCEGVKVDPKKIQSMQEWQRPETLKHLRGFLGLTGYHMKFVHHYGKISKPLTDLLKKNAFHWTLVAKKAFTNLKRAMCTTPILAMPDFNKTFVVESNASRISIGVVLTQDDKPLDFTSKSLSGCNLGRSMYEKYMMAILHAVHTWRPYLLGRRFQIKTDHHSLKYILEQRLFSLQQNKWLNKMLGYDYEIIYKKGKDNIVADALSHQHEEDNSLFSLSLPVHDWIEEVRQ
jgi:hypothetical protein